MILNIMEKFIYFSNSIKKNTLMIPSADELYGDLDFILQKDCGEGLAAQLAKSGTQSKFKLQSTWYWKTAGVLKSYTLLVLVLMFVFK